MCSDHVRHVKLLKCPHRAAMVCCKVIPTEVLVQEQLAFNSCSVSCFNFLLLWTQNSNIQYQLHILSTRQHWHILRLYPQRCWCRNSLHSIAVQCLVLIPSCYGHSDILVIDYVHKAAMVYFEITHRGVSVGTACIQQLLSVFLLLWRQLYTNYSCLDWSSCIYKL